MFSSQESAKKEKILCVNLQQLQSVQKRKEPPKKVVRKRVVSVKKTQTLKKTTKKKIQKVEKIHKTKKVQSMAKPFQKSLEAIAPQQASHKVCNKPVKKSPAKKAPSQRETYLQNHLQEIARLIQEHLYYPRRARKRGLEGEVLVTFLLSKNAQISSLKVLRSPSTVLTRAAIKSIEDVAPLLPKPEESLRLTIPIQYKLNKLLN